MDDLMDGPMGSIPGNAGTDHAGFSPREERQSASPAVLLEVTDGIGHLVLNRPWAANAIDRSMTDGLAKALDRCEEPDVGVVVVTGAGERFCAGGDVRSFVAAQDPASYLRHLATDAEAQLRRLGELAKPVVAGVHGAVAGAGLAFVLNADVALAGESTRFTMAYSKVGLTPDAGVSYLLPRVVGLRRALDLTLTEKTLSAPEALQWQLVTDVVPDDEVAARALAVARRLLDSDTTALGQARRLLRTAYDVPRSIHAADEAETIATAITSGAVRRRLAAFLTR